MIQRPARRERPHRDETGTALIELTWLGILLLVPTMWIVLAVFEVQRGAYGVSGAARAAARAFALAPDDGTGAARARAAAQQALADQGIGGAPLSVAISCTPYADCHSGGSVITVRVASSVTIPLLPPILGSGRPQFALDATHTVPIGQYVEISGAP